LASAESRAKQSGRKPPIAGDCCWARCESKEGCGRNPLMSVVVVVVVVYERNNAESKENE
jgi:hypothetical protein